MELDEHPDEGERTPEQEARMFFWKQPHPPYDFQSVGESPERPLQANQPVALAAECARQFRTCRRVKVRVRVGGVLRKWTCDAEGVDAVEARWFNIGDTPTRDVGEGQAAKAQVRRSSSGRCRRSRPGSRASPDKRPYGHAAEVTIRHGQPIIERLGQEEFLSLDARALAMLTKALPKEIYDHSLALRNTTCAGLLFLTLRSFQPGGLQERRPASGPD